MIELKRLERGAIPRALEKAERYRLLNEPHEAESICRDILAVDAEHQGAMVALLLALTDQFGEGVGTTPEHVRPLVERLRNPYERAYYGGMISERWAKANLGRMPGHVVYDWFAEAMQLFEKAEESAPAGNEDAVLRWNSCARILATSPSVRPRPEERAAEAESAYGDG